MNDPSADRTITPSVPPSSPRYRHVLARLERGSWRSGILTLAVSGAVGLALTNDLIPGSAQTLKTAAVGLFVFGVAQFVRWTAFHKAMEIHDHFASPAALRSSSGELNARSPLGFRPSLSMGSEVRWFGSTGDAGQRGWRFFDEFARFAGVAVARFAEHNGLWHEYVGLADPEGDDPVDDPPEGTVRFGRLLYRRVPHAPEGVDDRLVSAGLPPNTSAPDLAAI